MEITGLTFTVNHPENKHLCTDEDRVVSEEYLAEELRRLYLVLIDLEHQRDLPSPEEDTIIKLASDLKYKEAQRAELLSRMQCSQDQYEKQFGELEKKQQIVIQSIDPNAQEIRTVVLGTQYLEGAHWLCKPQYPCLPRCKELLKCDVDMFINQLCDVLKSITGMKAERVTQVRTAIATMVAQWNIRYEAIADLFTSQDCNFEERCRALKACNLRVNYADKVKDMLLDLMHITHNTANHCLVDLMRQVYSFQCVERDCLASVCNLFDCAVPPFENVKEAVKRVQCVMSRCGNYKELIDPLAGQIELLHQSHKGCETTVTTSACQLTQEIKCIQTRLAGIQCVVDKRHGQLNEEIGRVKAKICLLEKECACRQPKFSTKVPQDGSCGAAESTIELTVPCGEEVSVRTNLIMPGPTMLFSMAVFPRHDAHIASVKSNIEVLRLKIKGWSKIASGAEVPPASTIISLIAALLPNEKTQLLTLTSANPNPETTNLEARVDALVAQGMVAYWAKAISNMCVKLTVLTREQAEGIVKPTDDAREFTFRADWCWAGVLTVRIVNETLGTARFQNFKINILPSEASCYKTWEEWFGGCTAEPVFVSCDFILPDVGTMLSQQPLPKSTATNVKTQKRLTVPVSSLPSSQLGAYVDMCAAEMGLMDTGNPSKFLLMISQHGHADAKAAVGRIQDMLKTEAEMTVKHLTRFKHHSTVDTVLSAQTWEAYRNGLHCAEPLSVDCLETVSVSCGPASCTNTMDPEQREHWEKKCKRAAERRLLSEYPHYSLGFFFLASCKHLSAFVNVRSLSSRWTLSDFAQADTIGVGPTTMVKELNEKLCSMMEGLIEGSRLSMFVQDAISFGPMLSGFFYELCGAWSDFAQDAANLDQWIECVSCDTKTTDTEQQAIADALYDKLLLSRKKLEELVEQLPRCMTDQSELNALKNDLIGTTTVITPLAKKWELVVRAHELIVRLFTNQDGPWTTIAGTCHPLEWLGVSIEVASRLPLGQDVASLLDRLHRYLTEEHIPALISWLSFRLPPSDFPFVCDTACGACNLFIDGEVKKGVRSEIVNANEHIKEMTNDAYSGEQSAKAYDGFIDHTTAEGNTVHGLISLIKTETSKIMPQQVEIESLFSFMERLKVLYLSQSWIAWSESLKKHKTTPRDLVTCGMGEYAERWRSDPFTDFISEVHSESLSRSALIQPVYHEWLDCFVAWVKSNFNIFNAENCSADDSPLSNLEIIVKNFSDEQLLSIATQNDVPPLTMAHLVAAYRDLLDVANEQKTFMNPTRLYFSVEMMIALIYSTVSKIIHEKLQLMIDDICSHTICLPRDAADFQPDEIKRAASLKLMNDTASKLRSMEGKCSLFPSIWDTVKDEWQSHITRVKLHLAQNDIAVYHRKPWLGDGTETILAPERLHLIEVARRVFAIHTEYDSTIKPLIDHYQMLLRFIQKHYIKVDPPTETCNPGGEYIDAVHEYAIWLSTIENNSADPVREWAGSASEQNWIAHGVRAWEAMLRLEDALELALNSPGSCASTDNNCDIAETPDESWQARLSCVFTPLLEFAKTFPPWLKDLNTEVKSLFLLFKDVSRVLDHEFIREQFVIEAQRVYMIPAWLLDSLVRLFPTQNQKANTDGHYFDIINEVEMPTVSNADIAEIDWPKVRGSLRELPGFDVKLMAGLFPGMDYNLSLAFYVHLGEEIKNSPTLSVPRLTNMVNILRNHGAREAVYELLSDEKINYKYIFSNLHVDDSCMDSAGRITYFDAISSFFYGMTATHQQEIRSAFASSAVPDTVSNLPNPEANGDFSFYLRGGQPVSDWYHKCSDAAFANVDKLDMLNPEVLKMKDNFEFQADVWRTSRREFWWMGLTQCLENNHFNSQTFFLEFTRVFVALDVKYLQTDRLFPVLSEPPVVTEIVGSGYPEITWISQSLVKNAHPNQTEQQKQDHDVSAEYVTSLIEEKTGAVETVEE